VKGEKAMKRSLVFLAIASVLTSCAYFQPPKTLDQAKVDLDCVNYDKGISWAEISEKFGSPDVAPLPEPGVRLTRNARLYKGKTIIFYTEIQEVKEGEKIRFREVVTGIEVCKKK
jgi:hypothetical protein